MTEHVIETGLQLIDKRIQEVADKLGELAERHGGEVVDAALTVVQINAGEKLIIGMIFMSVFITLVYVCAKFIRRSIEWDKRNSDASPMIFGAVISGLLGIIAFILSGEGVLKLWNWIALFEPKLVIAKRILEGVL